MGMNAGIIIHTGSTKIILVLALPHIHSSMEDDGGIILA
jgi:hypothetical protein